MDLSTKCVCVRCLCLCLCQPCKLSLWVKLKHTPNHIPCFPLRNLHVGKVRSGVYECLHRLFGTSGDLVLNIISRDVGVAAEAVVHSQEFSSEKYSKTILFTV